MRAAVIWLEAVILGVMLVIGSTTMIWFYSIVNVELVSYTEDKTAFDTYGVVSQPEDIRYGRDIMLMLLNVDEMNPYPNKIKIDSSPVITLDVEWTLYKYKNAKDVYSPTGVYRLSNKMDSLIRAIRFEGEDTDGDNINDLEYWHIYIDNAPPVV